MSTSLENKKIAFLATDGVEQIELTRPWEDLKKVGATLELVSLEEGEIQGVHHDQQGDKFSVDRIAQDVSAKNYDGLVLPGGVFSPDALRMDENAVRFVKSFFQENKPVAAICHGPWSLVEADEVKGRTLTSWRSLKTDIENAGGTWVDKQVVSDHGLVTSRNPDDLDAFCGQIIELFAEGQRLKRSA